MLEALETYEEAIGVVTAMVALWERNADSVCLVTNEQIEF